MQLKKSKKPFNIILTFEGGITRSVKVSAATREVAEARALKRNPSATGVKRNAQPV